MSGSNFPSEITVQPVASWSQFTSCLNLRLTVYRDLGYLNADSNCDLDPFDWSSLHYIATDGNSEIAGTVRMILSQSDQAFVKAALLKSEQWCSRLLETHACAIEKSNSLPVIATLDDNRISVIVGPSRKLAELSRIIVAVKYRGSGVCRRLCEALIADAKRLRVETLFLQCLPCHVALFQKFGFEPVLRASEYRFLHVPDAVIVMRMSIDGIAWNREVSPEAS